MQVKPSLLIDPHYFLLDSKVMRFGPVMLLRKAVDRWKARAGSNESEPDDFVTGISDELTLNLTMKYRLPIGGIEDDPVAVYRLPAMVPSWADSTACVPTRPGAFATRPPSITRPNCV
jgi:hypothetical protein